MLARIVTVVAIVAGITSAASAQDVKLPEIDFGRYHALVIGNNDYQHLRKLATAVGPSETLVSLQQRLETARGREEALKQQLKTGLQDEKALRDLERATAEKLSQVRRRLVAAARELQGNEAALTTLEKELASLVDRRRKEHRASVRQNRGIATKLSKQAKSIGELIELIEKRNRQREEAARRRGTRPIITDARIGVHDGLTQFVLDVSAPIQVQRVFTLPAPYRVIIDLPISKDQPDLRNEQVNTGIISAYRSGRFGVRTFRLVLEVHGPVRVLRHYPLPGDRGLGHRYVFQLEPVNAATFARERQVPPIPRAKQERSANKTLIVIDPGHGGTDPGATRGKKMLEKNITLAVAKRIKKGLEKSSRYSVLLTRDGDIFMSLHDRVMVAQGRLADLFISIHTDSSRNPGIRGASVYRLSDKASDEEAEALTQKENQANVLAGVERFDSYGDSTRDFLVKLQQAKVQGRAIHFSGMLIEALRREKIRLLRNPRRYAGFVVLKAPEVASVLVTLGFISNKRDAGLMRSAKHQTKFARAVRRAVDRYFTDEISGNGDTAIVQPSIEGELTELAPGTVFRDCPECPEMVVIPAGNFTMGSPASEKRYDNEGPRHRVTIPRAFALGKYEVTFAEWDACVRAGGCSHRASDAGWGRGNRPVTNVSWDDAKQYVGWLSRQTGRVYQLPSEAEWEYAARAGTTTARYWGEDADRACAHGNVHDRTGKSENNSGWDHHHECRDGYAKTAPVGSFRANDFGLHDMLGNVWEWVEDCWNDSYKGGPSDGSAWTTGDCTRRVMRGGSWGSIPRLARAALRLWGTTGNRKGNGFRIARTLEPSSPSEEPPKRIARVAPSLPPNEPPRTPVVPPRQPEPKAEPKPAPLPKPKPRVRATPAPVPEPQPDLKLTSTGSGFYVSGDGYIVTNEHVVNGCMKLAVMDADKRVRKVSVVASDANSDLALLKDYSRPPSFAAFRNGKGARPGETIVVIGFPLAGSLSSTVKITTGIVNSDAGPRDDPGMLQISAPVQPGNSGGPLLDARGHLIGVVVSTIKKKEFAEAFGRPPENVNFAIKARLVRRLLDAHGVNYRTETATTKLDPAGIYERARPFTVLIVCWK